jgi:pimeloyl-ACP methyl ester carboxylesterase
VDLSPTNGSNVRAAEQQLRPAALRLLETARASALRAGHRAPPAHLAVVGHSMGAFSGRWLAARILPEKVRLFVSIAGANFGTNALCRLSGEGNREMCPAFAQDRRTNPAQVELNGSAAEPRDPTPFGLGPDPSDGPSVPPDRRAIAYYTVRFDGDPWIKPNRSAELPGAGGLVLPPAGAGLSETAPGNFLLSPASGHAPPTARPGVIGRVKRLLLGSPWADHDSLPADPRIIDWVEMLLRASRDAAWPRPGGK